MGKLKELLDEYKRTENGSASETECISKINIIVEWMKENGHMDKPFKLPSKKRWKPYGWYSDFPTEGLEDGDYCSHEGCFAKLPDPPRTQCKKCGWGLGVVWTVSNPKVLNSRIRRV